MRYFFDTEFIEDGKTIDLISIGIVAEDGREYYAENYEADTSKASDWVVINVLAHLKGGGLAKHRLQIRDEVLAFIGQDDPEIWAYYADYDWVALCQLFGTMMDLPRGWPMYCRDIKQLVDHLSPQILPAQDGQEHHALADARWNKQAYNFLMSLESLRDEP
jgi:hypothetical protein